MLQYRIDKVKVTFNLRDLRIMKTNCFVFALFFCETAIALLFTRFSVASLICYGFPFVCNHKISFLLTLLNQYLVLIGYCRAWQVNTRPPVRLLFVIFPVLPTKLVPTLQIKIIKIK